MNLMASQITSIIGSDAIKLALQLVALLLIQMFANGAREALDNGRVLNQVRANARLNQHRQVDHQDQQGDQDRPSLGDS